MRIRQRKKTFPLSSFSPVTLSDPSPISRSSVAVVQLNDDALPPKPSTPEPHSHASSDHRRLDRKLPPTGFDPTGDSGLQIQARNTEEDCLEEDGRDQEAGEGEKGNDTRKGDIFGSSTAFEDLSPSSPSNQDWRWCEGEKAIPLKKRRGSFPRRIMSDQTVENANNNNNSKKMNKKCSNDNEQHEEEKKRPSKAGGGGGGKKRVRGSALMEGSRCSRVNGRGWRCSQPTLVGYSLCEHHLGKGRLRSMSNNVKISSSIGCTESVPPLGDSSSSSSSSGKLTTKSVPLGKNDDGEDEKKPLTSMKKRMKHGLVKARSISSLLCQTKTESPS